MSQFSMTCTGCEDFVYTFDGESLEEAMTATDACNAHEREKHLPRGSGFLLKEVTDERTE